MEKLCRRVLERRLASWDATLNADQKEDALTFLIETAWKLSLKYDPDRGLSFSTYAYRLLSLRVADWYRKTFGDSRRGPIPERYSLSDIDAETIPAKDETGATELRIALAQEGRRLERRHSLAWYFATQKAEGRSTYSIAREVGWRKEDVERALDELAEELQDAKDDLS